MASRSRRPRKKRKKMLCAAFSVKRLASVRCRTASGCRPPPARTAIASSVSASASSSLRERLVAPVDLGRFPFDRDAGAQRRMERSLCLAASAARVPRTGYHGGYSRRSTAPRSLPRGPIQRPTDTGLLDRTTANLPFQARLTQASTRSKPGPPNRPREKIARVAGESLSIAVSRVRNGG